METLPKQTPLAVRDTHRLIPAKYVEDEDSVLTRIAKHDDHLQDIFDLDHATNDRLLAENDLLPGIDARELVFGVPHYRVVNAAFCHAHPLGSRFNGPERGAWYAGFELHTAKAEILFHKSVELAEIKWEREEVIAYRDYLADFTQSFHDCRDALECADCLDPDSYVASQHLAALLMQAGANGIVYPSVRSQGTCLACFVPALVTNVRQGGRYAFHWKGTGKKARMHKHGDGAGVA